MCWRLTTAVLVLLAHKDVGQHGDPPLLYHEVEEAVGEHGAAPQGRVPGADDHLHVPEKRCCFVMIRAAVANSISLCTSAFPRA